MHRAVETSASGWSGKLPVDVFLYPQATRNSDGGACALRSDATKLPFTADRCWPDVPDPVVGCMTCQFDRQVYGIEIAFA
jgi:hypothetical protein